MGSIARANIDDEMKKLNVFVEIHSDLLYALHVSSYRDKSTEPVETNRHQYQTDLLIAEHRGGSTDWVPRVVVECKLRVNTHDVLAYSAKAATHKNVHPYLRYGIVIGRHPGRFPRRLIWHGHQFDFLLTVASEKLTAEDRQRLCQLFQDEVRASRELETLLSDKSDTRLVHRKLVTSVR